MERICGICPVSHLLASAKACDALLAMKVPPSRRQAAPHSESRATHSVARVEFFLSFVAGFSHGNGCRSQRTQSLRRDAARIRNWAAAESGLRQFGQQVIETLAGKRIHPGWVVPGGVNEPLTIEKRDKILAQIPEVIAIAQKALAWFKIEFENFGEEIRTFANFPSLFMGLVTPDERAGYYEGKIRFTDSHGNIVADNLECGKLLRLSGRSGGAVHLHEVSLLQAPGLSRGDLPRGPAGAHQPGGELRHSPRPTGMDRVPRTGTQAPC